MNTINCRLSKRNRETAVAISNSNNDQESSYYGTPEKLWAYTGGREERAIPIDILPVSMQGPGSQKHESGLYTTNRSRNRE